MTPRERLLSALEGRAVDRVPLYPLIPFGLGPEGFHPAAFHGYGEADDWRSRDPEYRRLVARSERECDNFFIWRPPCMENDQLFLPVSKTGAFPVEESGGRIRRRYRMTAGGLTLTSTVESQRGTGHSWVTEHWCKSAEDAWRLLDAPWDGHAPAAGDFHGLQGLLGEKGVMWVTVPSPIQAACRLFDPMEFLVFVRTEADLVDRLMEAAAGRIAANLEALLDQGVGPVIRFGGAEHATPPLMSPDDFDRLVVRWDAPLVDLCARRGRRTAVHCHGRLRHALRRFREMGIDQVDPVETAPDGDIGLEEARRIAGDRVTLTGNIQAAEIAQADPERIRSRVKEIVEKLGPRRLVLSTTGTPLERITARAAANYDALIDAAREFGAVR